MNFKIKTCFIISVIFALSGCGKDEEAIPAGDCSTKLELYTIRLNTFTTAPTKANCETLVNTLDSIIKDCTFIGAGQRDALQTSRNEINCSTF